MRSHRLARLSPRRASVRRTQAFLRGSAPTAAGRGIPAPHWPLRVLHHLAKPTRTSTTPSSEKRPSDGQRRSPADPRVDAAYAAAVVAAWASRRLGILSPDPTRAAA